MCRSYATNIKFDHRYGSCCCWWLDSRDVGGVKSSTLNSQAIQRRYERVVLRAPDLLRLLFGKPRYLFTF